jgi:hypothetical protein
MSQESVNNHIASLKNKHKELDIQLEELYKHSSASDESITKIKKQKLDIKDQIIKLEKGLNNG